MEMQINVNTKIIYMDSAVPVMRAIENVKRDIRKVCCDSDEKGCDIVLIMENMQAEQFEIKCDNNMLVIYASDTLGFVYGLYHISRDILGVLPFWFWNDQVFIKKKGCRISGEYAYTSKPYAVKYRGWFVNDEVLIHKWYVDRKKDMPWEMVFEALLRCGGNLVIPGTDKNSHIYRDLAADMGLRITHHHAEPLGAPMFARRYPELTPSYDEYPEKFHELWKEGIDEQKKLDVIWNLGFRGQGDCPFWDNDPRYQTSESRGELMGKLIGLQRDYVQNEIPDAQYCTNLYGETTLSREFRTMLETVDTLIHENYEKQLLLKDTKYKMLRAQINPHFLYNTLNVIHWMIRAKRNEEAGRMIVELGDILHYSFSQTPYAIISDEIKMVKSYIKIQQSRYQDRIKFEIFTEGALDKYIMPRMILQPLVENAISYGAGLLCRVVKYFKELIAGVGAVRTTLHKYVSNN